MIIKIRLLSLLKIYLIKGKNMYLKLNSKELKNINKSITFISDKFLNEKMNFFQLITPSCEKVPAPLNLILKVVEAIEFLNESKEDEAILDVDFMEIIILREVGVYRDFDTKFSEKIIKLFYENRDYKKIQSARNFFYEKA